MTYDPFENFKDTPVDQNIRQSVLQTSKAQMSPKVRDVALKYSLLFACSIFLSLIICPQRGVGFLRESYPFFHHLLHQSEALCGLYCGFVFYATTHVLSFFLLTHFERLVLIKRITYLPIIFISAFFGLSMTSLFSDLALSASYFLAWISVAFFGYMVLNFYYKSSYQGGLTR